MEYLFELLYLVNNYNGSNENESRIRDLICFISENEEYFKNDLYRTVLFEAAEKLRVFGYIKGIRKIEIEEFGNDSIFDIKHQTIQNYYSSKIFNNNILDRKQKDIVDTYMNLEIKRILVSAPTSFGKTFILREIIFMNYKRYRNILLVFPTIALLNENTDNMKKLINALKSNYIIVNNVYSQINECEKHIFILTPERTLKLLSDNEGLHIDFFFFDEVYKIDEDFSADEDTVKENGDLQVIKRDSGNRAKAFRITLYLLSKRVNEFYLAGPYLNLDSLKIGFARYIKMCKITPIQSEFEPTMRIEIDAWKKGSVEIHPILGKRNINIYENGCLTTINKIVGITKYLKDNDLGQSIFYCSTPHNSMSYVRSIIEALPMRVDSLKINADFIEHLKKKYGFSIENSNGNTADYWSLVKALENGYGVHHGKFPKYIQNEVLRMFNQNKFDNLFCTSTIIEGVNTNAKNVVIVNNSIGNATMSAFSLKNIKGRAGRYYHHYVGRVFYTDPKQRDIEQSAQLQLDFPTFNNMSLLTADLDNADIEDLLPENKQSKIDRDRTLNFELLPDTVFIKNRLYARDQQERYLSYLMDPFEFEKYANLIHGSGNIGMFLKGKYMDMILKSFEATEVIDMNKANIYHSVVANYSMDGTRGVLLYHIRKHIKLAKDKDKDPMKEIDRAYIESFSQIRNIVEYEVPKLLCLFEALFAHAATLKGYNMAQFNMSPIIRFFELGITTEFGLYLVEFGFPIDTIRALEKEFPNLSIMSISESIIYLRNRYIDVLEIIDSYELTLFRSAIQAFEK